MNHNIFGEEIVEYATSLCFILVSTRGKLKTKMKNPKVIFAIALHRGPVANNYEIYEGLTVDCTTSLPLLTCSH